MLTKYPYEAKYKMLIEKRESSGIKHLNDSKAFIEYSNEMDDIYKNIEEYNPDKKRKILIVFDDMIADMLSNKKLNPIVTELFISNRKLTFLLFVLDNLILQRKKKIRLISTHYFIRKIPNKQELQQIAYNHSSDIDFKDFMNLYEKCTAKPYFLKNIYATLASDNSSYFRKNLLERM